MRVLGPQNLRQVLPFACHWHCGLDHPSLALEGWSVGIVVLAWTLDPDVLSLSLCPKHQDAIKNYLCSPWVGGCGGAPGRDISQESGSSVECEQCAQGGGSV